MGNKGSKGKGQRPPVKSDSRGFKFNNGPGGNVRDAGKSAPPAPSNPGQNGSGYTQYPPPAPQSQPAPAKQNDAASSKDTDNDSDVDIDDDSGPAEQVAIEDVGDSSRRQNQKVSVDDFDLLKVLGKGSFGKVMMVRKKDTQKIYALKTLRKAALVKRNQLMHTRTERSILQNIKHPYLTSLAYAFQTPDKLYLVMDYCGGGELFFWLKKDRRFSQNKARLYAAEIILALQELHRHDIIYRDLKPENILFDDKGHILLADFGLAKEGITDGAEGTNSMCGTPEYLPPEILDRTGHGTAVDWWALGMVLYEMLTGLPPWYTRNRQKLFDRVRNAPLTFPDEVGPSARSLISGLLNRNPVERLGSRSADDVKNHEFFREINWQDLYDRKIRPPFNPCDATTTLDATENFEPEFTKMPVNSVPENGIGSLRISDASRPSMTFQGFTFNTPSDLNSMGASVGRS